MKNPSLKFIVILTLIGIAIGLLVCLFWGGLEIGAVIFITAVILSIGLSGVEPAAPQNSAEMNSFLYRTDLGTGKLISELEKANKDKPGADVFCSAEMNSVMYSTDLATGKLISELQRLNKK